MSTERQEVVAVDAILDGLESPSSTDVVLATIEHSERSIAAVAAKRALSSGGGSQPIVNWCQVNIAPPDDPLTHAARSYDYLEADLSIASQSGSDFSVGSHGGKGAVLSASGGQFVTAVISNPLYDATLDSGSALLRWLQVAWLSGPSSDDANALGGDFLVPVLAGLDNALQGSVTQPSAPGYVPPGGPTFNTLSVALIGSTGSDSVPLDQGPFYVLIWQTAAAS